MDRTIRLGTRSSALARWQAEWVSARLVQARVTVELITISTLGDVTTGPLAQSGSQGLFTKEIQRALLASQIDIAVHSLKDLPTEEVPGLVLAAVPPRAKVNDALISRQGHGLEGLLSGASIGTGSIRRRAQLLHVRPDLKMVDIRGNVDTRLRKLDEGQYDAIVLASAGLNRLGWTDRITQELPLATMLPAVGQGALGIECRADDAEVLRVLRALDDVASHAAVVAERAMLAALRGGCSAPIGGWGRVDGGRLLLDGVVLSIDGRQRLTATGAATADDPAGLGRRVAEQLLDQGAAGLIRG